MKEIGRACVVLAFFMLLIGIGYTFLITGIGQLFFPTQVNGSLINQGGTLLGSQLIGQEFTSPRYFWGRPSATTPPYNPLASSPSNLGPLNPQLLSNVEARISKLVAADPSQTSDIPVVLVTSSGSGLDPDISVLAANYQAPRIARLRHLSEGSVNALIQDNITPPQFGFMGWSRINVLRLNLALDALSEKESGS